MSNTTFRPQPGAYYTLEFRYLSSIDTVEDNGRISVPGHSQGSGVAVSAIPVPSSNEPDHSAQWSFDEVEPGWFIITARHSGKVLDVRNASVNENATIQQHSRHAVDSPHRFAQHFSVNLIDSRSSPYHTRYVIRSRVSQKVLARGISIMGGSAPVAQSQYDDPRMEQLAINPVGVDTFVPDPNLYYFIRNIHSGKVFDVSSGWHDGATMGPMDESKNLSLSQQWYFEPVEAGWYILHPRHSDLALGVTGSSTADGADLQQWTRNGSHNQQWKIKRRGDDFVLINRNSGKLASWIFGNRPGGEVRQYPDNPSDGTRQQTWRFDVVPAQPFEPLPGVYYTLKFAHSGLAVAVAGGKADEGAPVVQLAESGQPYTQWRFEKVGKTFYHVVARHSGKVLSLPTDTINEGTPLVQQAATATPSRRQQWALDASPTGLVLCNRFSNRVLDVVGDSTATGAVVQQTTRLQSGNPTVSATPNTVPDFKPRSDAWYVLRFAHSGKILTVSLGSSANGATIWQAFDNGGYHQHWRFTEVEPGWFVVTARHSGKVLDLANGGLGDGAKIHQWARMDGNYNQHWALVPTPYGWALRARKSGKPIEIPNDSQSHGTLIVQGSPQWDQNQSLRPEVYVSDATAATPVVRYTAPSLPAPAIGVSGGPASGGSPTASPTTSATVPAAVSAVSPLATSVFFVPCSLPIAFTGSVTTQALSAGQSFVGPAQLPAPFSIAVSSLRLLVTPDPGVTLTFSLPSDRSLKTIIETELISQISDSTVRDIVNITLKPFAALLPTPTVILSTVDGEDETFGSYMAGFNAFASLPISDIPPFSLLHSLFPQAGLASRSLTLGIGTNGAQSPSERAFWVSGNAWLDMPLIPSFLTLKELSLSLGKTATSVNTAGELVLALKVPGEELSLRGGIDTTIEAGVSQSTVWAALDVDDGMWENAFGIPGLNIAGMGIQITSGGGIGVRGELHLGNGLLGARVGILIDPAAPQNSILDIYSEEGLQLPRLLSPLLGNLVDLNTVCDIALTELQLYVAPTGGSIAGQDYPQGTTIGGKLHLWGWGAAARGTVTSNSLDLFAQADPLHLQVGGVPYLDFSSAEDPAVGPSFQFMLSSRQFSGSISASVKLLGGAIHGSLAGMINSRGFTGTLVAGTGTIYAATHIKLEQGLFRLAFSPTFAAAVTIGGYRVEISGSTTIAVEVNSSYFKQSISFQFSAMGKTYAPGPFGVDVPFRDADDLAAAFYEYAADLLTEELCNVLRNVSEAAINWVKQQITAILDDAAQLFNGIGADATAAANGMKNAWNASAQDMARVMNSAYSWTVNQTGDYLRSAYNLSKDELAGALKTAGYAAEEVSNLFTSYGGEFADWAEENLNPFN